MTKEVTAPEELIHLKNLVQSIESKELSIRSNGRDVTEDERKLLLLDIAFLEECLSTIRNGD